MRDLLAEIKNEKHWQETYDKLSLKNYLSDEDKGTLWKTKDLLREKIIEELWNGTYNWSIPRKVEIAKHESGKKRIVYIYDIKDRYILGVLYRAVSAYFASEFADNCFSYKKGTSTGNAIGYIKENRTDDLKVGVKIDIHAYFNSVNEQRVHEVIDGLFTSGIKKTLENLMFNNKVIWRGQVIQEWKSLIPGCAFGSFFANVCLKPCDDYFNSKDCVYARYSDDIIILERTKEDLQKDIEVIKGFLNKYGLVINESKYKWFDVNDDVEFLGLKLRADGRVDVSDHAKKKMKKQIHRWCRKGRMAIERDHKSFESVARSVFRKVNNRNFFCVVDNSTKFGWAQYSFNRITTIDSLIELDFYLRDRIRAMKTGHNNKANAKAMTEEEFKRLGYLSLVDMYNLFKKDFDYYLEIVELSRDIKWH